MIQSRILRCIQQKRTNLLPQRLLTKSLSSDSSDEDKKKKSVKFSERQSINKKSEDALKKLNLLLQQMVEEDFNEPTKRLNQAKPKGRSREIKESKQSNDILTAAKDVAKSLGGNVKQTESELLNKLLNPITSQSTDDASKKASNLNEMIAGMKIDRSVKPDTSANFSSKAYRVKQLTNREEITEQQHKSHSVLRRTSKPPSSMEKIDLFGGEALGIFTERQGKFKDEQPVLRTWARLQERELQLAVTHPPANYFEEMMLWTKQGKVWTFPIDNETGMEEEKNVYFAEHIFLEKHIESWCPQRGPVRHFMELVCVGLSKNPYLTVQAKRDHIEWFKTYFTSKEQLLKEIGAIPADIKQIKELDG